MTTSLPHTHIPQRDLSALVAGIPYVIGFPPTDSLVLLTFRRCPDLALSTTVRVNLPKPEHTSLVADELAAAVARNEVVAAIAVVVADTAPEHHGLIDLLRKALADKEILLSHASWVRQVTHGELWQCYDDPLCTGVVPDPQSSALAAAVAVAGDTIFPSREAVGAHLAPDSEEALGRRRNLLDAYRGSEARRRTERELQADLETLSHALDEAACSYDPPTLNDHQLVRLAQALSQPPVKDECFALALSPKSEPAERLWTVMVRGLPAPERAEPAFLLAISSYLRGSGVLAALALKIVMESNPAHAMAFLLDRALQKGVSPTLLRSLIVTSLVKNNKTSLDDDPPWDTTPEPPTPEPETNTRSARETPDTEPEIDSTAPETTPKVPMPLATASLPTPADSTQTPTTPEAPSERMPTMLSTPAADHDMASSCACSPQISTAVPTLVAPEMAIREALDREFFAPPMPAANTTASLPDDREFFAVPTSAPGSVHTGTGGQTPSPVDEVVDPGRVPTTEPPRIAPGALSREAADALGISTGTPARRTIPMDALTAFLPPPTDRSGPG
jgi:hypothetical protein